jgi:hypothetical protein
MDFVPLGTITLAFVREHIDDIAPHAEDRASLRGALRDTAGVRPSDSRSPRRPRPRPPERR